MCLLHPYLIHVLLVQLAREGFAALSYGATIVVCQLQKKTELTGETKINVSSYTVLTDQ